MFQCKDLQNFILSKFKINEPKDITIEMLQSVTDLELTTEEYQLWDESPEDSCITSTFYDMKDLDNFPNLKHIVIGGQPISGHIKLPDSLENVLICGCLNVHISIGGNEYHIPTKKCFEWDSVKGVIKLDS